ncbi:hypothetical protein STCU_11795 [Strigomonas culicis]|uniref:Uncharacterized protein n=1 Tax=Strigomonas culicis TaxID=28005 RepID=S9UM22_9TRYP|nr:hypothetical protein STCU_11795 [Strigomonas culicis]|eukprot:EPY15746.1 hypothetical protein STCU_11795 [Strigomonas culicis]
MPLPATLLVADKGHDADGEEAASDPKPATAEPFVEVCPLSITPYKDYYALCARHYRKRMRSLEKDAILRQLADDSGSRRPFLRYWREKEAAEDAAAAEAGADADQEREEEEEEEPAADGEGDKELQFDLTPAPDAEAAVDDDAEAPRRRRRRTGCRSCCRTTSSTWSACWRPCTAGCCRRRRAARTRAPSPSARAITR